MKRYLILVVTVFFTGLIITACTGDGGISEGDEPENTSSCLAIDQSVSIEQGDAANISLVGTSTDGDALTYLVASQPVSGELTGSAPNPTYMPGVSFSGSDSFTFTVADSQTTSEPATVTIMEMVSGSDISLSITEHPENTLMAVAYVNINQNAAVSIEFTSDETAVHQTANSEIGTDHEITIIGMRAETVYTMTAVATFANGSVGRSDPVKFTTGLLPANAPAISLLTFTGQSDGGITFLGVMSDTPRYWGVDEEGEIVWYLHGNYTTSNTTFLRVNEPGVLLIMLNDSIRTITTAGETLKTYPTERLHHDILLLPNGNVMMLGFETCTTEEGIRLGGDTIIEQDADGDILWQWSSFDHLDKTRIMNNSTTANGALDWSHSNALFYMEDDDTILLSVRSQSWILKIDHVTGDVIWIMGDNAGTDESYKYNNKFMALETGTWMNSQHAPMMTAGGEILVYDNRNESGGPTLMSRAVKFTIDELAMTATQTWEAIALKYTGSLGDVDELSNGNVMMCSGGPGSSDTSAYILEVSSDESAEPLWSIRIEDDKLYRAERMNWNSFLNSNDN